MRGLAMALSSSVAYRGVALGGRRRIPSLTFLLIGWFSPAEEAKRPICSGFLRFRPERKGVYTNRLGNGPTEECEKSVLVEDPGASGCARSGAGLPDEAFRRFARDSSS